MEREHSSLYVVTLSWLQTIPRDLPDAAVIDGATRVAIFWRITFPILVPTLSVITVLLSVWTFNEFAAIWLMTEAGPGDMTMTFSPLVYQTTFRFYRIGYGASIGIFMMLVVLPLAAAYASRVRKRGIF